MDKSAACATFQVFLRILVILVSLAATILIVTRKQSTRVYGISLKAQYDNSTAFEFFVHADWIASGLSVLSVIVAAFACRRVFRASNCFSLPNLDLAVMLLVMAVFAAAAAVGYVRKYGDSHIGWMPICDHVSRFCNRVILSIAASLIAFLSLKLLANMAVFRV